MKHALFFILSCVMSFSRIYASDPTEVPLNSQMYIVGGGIIGALESYYAYQDALKSGKKICITVFEKGESFDRSSQGDSSTNTSYNIVPSLTTDEILSVVPRGSELVEKLAILFNQPGGIRVDDVEGVNDSTSAVQFKEAVAKYGSDKLHDDRTLSLLRLGKISMDLWQQMYDEGDAELKAILETSNFNPCHETTQGSQRTLHDGYRIDLIYGIVNARQHALNMQTDYEKIGYKNCAILSPDEAVAIDPYIEDFCHDHSELVGNTRVWKKDSIALWRPGGCIDGRTFLPKFYAYLKKIMGKYEDAQGDLRDCFELKFNSEVIGVDLDSCCNKSRIIGLRFSNGGQLVENRAQFDCRYVFCPGESVGTLQRLGFNEPAYSAFAGASLMMMIPISKEDCEKYKNYSHCMEVHSEGIVLPIQARVKENSISIGAAGTKAFYGDKAPHKNEEFATNRNLVQLNMVNNVLPEFMSLAFGYCTHGKTLSAEELSFLENQGIVQRWVGRRAVAFDGFPTIGALYSDARRVTNARCTTHLGSGGVSFGPGAVFISRSSESNIEDLFIQKILKYADSRRLAE